MDFELSEHHLELRCRIREIIAATVTPEIVDDTHRSGTNHAPAFLHALGDAGILARAMPGPDQDPVEMWIVSSEAEKLGAPFDTGGMAISIAGVLAQMGTDDQKRRIMPGLLSGREVVCFGLTEPDGGSDLPRIKTRATRNETGDGWIINGAKMWTTMAHIADWVFLLARTDATAGRYGGFTTFILPMSTPGITVDPVWTMGTERSNATFYDDVRVGDECVIGEPNEGWTTMGVMLGFERGLGNTGALTPLLRRFVTWASETGVIDDPLVRERMAQIAVEAQVAELLTQRTVWTIATGAAPGTEGSIAKVYATEAYQRAARWAQAAAGPDGLLRFHEAGAAAHGWIDYDVRHSTPQTLQGGTSEINRNNIAERHLGLPRMR
jgi:3-oxocholest-4-en-26-oyl-CoA dehydrogenase alpha subunit